MKKFVANIIGFALVTLAAMYFLDLGYTAIYSNSSPRTKVQYLRKFKNQKFDYIFIGSSRVASGIVPSVIEERTHKKALNLGFQAAKLHDIYTILQLVKYYDLDFDKIFIQVDYIYNTDTSSTLFKPEVLPFIYENDIYRRQIEFSCPNYPKYYNVPFYRYCRNDLKLGFREAVLNLIKKKTQAMSYGGYGPLEGTTDVHKFGLPETINQDNRNIDSIRNFCKINKIDVVFYCAPFCKHTQNLNFVSKLQAKIPGLYDFSSVIKDEKMFQNASHMNDAGAKLFTNIFIDKVLKN